MYMFSPILIYLVIYLFVNLLNIKTSRFLKTCFRASVYQILSQYYIISGVTGQGTSILLKKVSVECKLIAGFTEPDFTFYDSPQVICNVSTFVLIVETLCSISELDCYVIVSTFTSRSGNELFDAKLKVLESNSVTVLRLTL